MTTENILMEFGFIKEEDGTQLKQRIRDTGRLKEVHIDVYPENPFTSSNSFMLLLRATEANATISIDEGRLVFRKNDKYETHFMNVLISKITECFYKICEGYLEFILNIQNVYYKITVFN